MKARKAIFLFLLLSIGCIPVFAQQDWGNEGELESVEVQIVNQRQIKLPKASRHFDKIPPRPFEPITPAITYDYKTLDISAPPINQLVRPLRLKQEAPEKLYGGYLRGGYGNYASPFLDLFVNTANAKDRLIGAHAYLKTSGKGPVDDDNSSNGEYGLNFFARGFSNNLTAGLNLDYNNRYTHFYGYPSGTEVKEDTIRQTYNSFSLGGDLANVKNSNFHYTLRGKFNHLDDRFKASEEEGNIGLESEFRMKNDRNIQLKAGYDIMARKDQGVQTKTRSLFTLNPFMYFKPSDEFSAKVGFAIALDNDSLNRRPFHFYPDIEVQYPLSTNAVLVGSFTGGMEKVTLRSLSNENIWIGPAVALNHTNKEFEFAGALHVNLGGKFQMRTGFSFAGLKNYYYFINDTTDVSKFNVVYDQGRTNRSNVYASLEFVQHTVFSFLVRGDIYHYGTEKVSEPWHRPGYKLTADMRYDLYHKLYFDLGVMALGNTKAQDPETKTTVSLDAAFDLNAKVEYKFSDRFSAFIQGSNLTSKQYPLFLNYPSRGLQVSGGVCWTF